MPSDHFLPHIVPYLIPITQMAFAGSVFTTLALTVERYISVVVPFFRQRHNLKAWKFIVPIGIFVTAYNIPRFFEIELVNHCSNLFEMSNNGTNSSSNAVAASENCSSQLMPTRLRQDDYYVKVSDPGCFLVDCHRMMK